MDEPTLDVDLDLDDFLSWPVALAYGMTLTPFALVAGLSWIVVQIGVSLIVGASVASAAAGTVVLALGLVGLVAGLGGGLFKLLVDAQTLSGE